MGRVVETKCDCSVVVLGSGMEVIRVLVVLVGRFLRWHPEKQERSGQFRFKA